MTSDSKIVNIPDICYMVSLGWIVSASGSLAIESIKYWISGKINSAPITSFTRKKTLRHGSPTRRTGLKQTFVKLERKCAMKEMECKTTKGDTTTHHARNQTGNTTLQGRRKRSSFYYHRIPTFYIHIFIHWVKRLKNNQKNILGPEYSRKCQETLHYILSVVYMNSTPSVKE